MSDATSNAWVDFPPSNEATFSTMRDSLIAYGEALRNESYPPGDLAAAFIAAGAILAADNGGPAQALGYLTQVMGAVRNVAERSAICGPVAGRA